MGNKGPKAESNEHRLYNPNDLQLLNYDEMQVVKDVGFLGRLEKLPHDILAFPPCGDEVRHERKIRAKGIQLVGSLRFMQRTVLQDANATLPHATHPRIQAFLGIIAMVKRIAVDEIDRVHPFGLNIVKIPPDGVGKILGRRGNFRANHIAAQILSKPFLFLASPCPVANPKLWGINHTLDIRRQESDILFNNPNTIDLVFVATLLDLPVLLIVKGTVALQVTVEHKSTVLSPSILDTCDLIAKEFKELLYQAFQHGSSPLLIFSMLLALGPCSSLKSYPQTFSGPY
jgi:hypothetical protein